MKDGGLPTRPQGGGDGREGDITVLELQRHLATASGRLNCGWLCCVIDRTGWFPVDHWYPDAPRAPDTPHAVALTRNPRELVAALDRYVRGFRRPDVPPTEAGARCAHRDGRPGGPQAAAPARPAGRVPADAAPHDGPGTPRLALSLPPRVARPRVGEARGPTRCPGHLAFVRGHACCVAGPECSGPVEAAHVRRGSGAGMGRKPDDDRAVSLCRWHHRQQHDLGEARFERLHGVDLEALAREFARRSPSWQRLLARQRASRDPR